MCGTHADITGEMAFATPHTREFEERRGAPVFGYVSLRDSVCKQRMLLAEVSTDISTR